MTGHVVRSAATQVAESPDLARARAKSRALTVHLGLIVLLLAAGCGRKSANPITTSTATTVKATPPVIINTGTDYTAIITSMVHYNDWMLSHPDLADPLKVYTPDCPCIKTVVHEFTTFNEKHEHQLPVLSTIESVKVLQQLSPQLVSLSVSLSSDERSIVDADGERTSSIAGYDHLLTNFTLFQINGHWFVQDVKPLGGGS